MRGLSCIVKSAQFNHTGTSSWREMWLWKGGTERCKVADSENRGREPGSKSRNRQHLMVKKTWKEILPSCHPKVTQLYQHFESSEIYVQTANVQNCKMINLEVVLISQIKFMAICYSSNRKLLMIHDCLNQNKTSKKKNSNL